jgi:hypothetical protein
MRRTIAAVAGPMLSVRISAGPEQTAEGYGRSCPRTQSEAHPERRTSRALRRLDSRDQEALLLSHVVDDRLPRHGRLVDRGQHADAVGIEEGDQVGGERAHPGSAARVYHWARSINRRSVAPGEVIRHHTVHVI